MHMELSRLVMYCKEVRKIGVRRRDGEKYCFSCLRESGYTCLTCLSYSIRCICVVGAPADWALGTLRVSVGRCTTLEEIKQAASYIAQAYVEELTEKYGQNLITKPEMNDN